MTKLEISLIVVVAGLMAYIWLTWKPAEIIVGPSQHELDSFKVESAKKLDSLKIDLKRIKSTRTKDSIRYVQERTNSSKAISYWKKRVSESKAHVSDSLPDSTMVIEQAKVIVFQDSVIEKQGKRIVNDSLYIVNIESNFAQRLANEKQQRELLEQENKLQGEVIKDQAAELPKQRRKGFWNGIKIGTPAGVILTLILFL